MIQRIKTILVTLSLSSLMLSPGLVPAIAHAFPSTYSASTTGALCGGASLTVTNGSCTNTTNNLNKIIKFILNLFSVIVGIIAVIMIVVGGLKYTISGGDSTRVSGAKDTILFAIVGLVVVAFAQVIVHFVLSGVQSNGGG